MAGWAPVAPSESSTACGSTGSTASSDSRTPFGDPGRLMTSASPIVPAVPRDSAAIGVCASPAARISSLNPGASRSSTALVASGVTSRGPNPVPPVVTTSVCDAARRTSVRSISARSSGTTSRDRDVEPGAGEQLLRPRRPSRRRACRRRPRRRSSGPQRSVAPSGHPPTRPRGRRQAVGCSASTIPAATAGAVARLLCRLNTARPRTSAPLLSSHSVSWSSVDRGATSQVQYTTVGRPSSSGSASIASRVPFAGPTPAMTRPLHPGPDDERVGGRQRAGVDRAQRRGGRLGPEGAKLVAERPGDREREPAPRLVEDQHPHRPYG